MRWGDLFERAAAVETTESAVRTALADRRRGENGPTADESDDDRGDEPPDSADPTTVVADADVLAADLLVGDSARAALDRVREHSWLTLAASDPLLADAEAVIATVADRALAADWRDRARTASVQVRHPPGDHPGLATAYRGGAAHLLSLDEDLTTARAGLSVQPHAALSVRSPDAFAAVFDPAPLYETEVGEQYQGPDRDPRG